MTTSTCGACGALDAISRCGRCQSIRYCNATCQAKDWPVHKVLCKKLHPTYDKIDLKGKVLQELPTDVTTKKPPKAELFPSQLQNFEYQSSGDGYDENLLILFHGLGDTHKSFAAFAKKLALPQTATLAISAPIRFPEEIVHGRSWFTAHDASWELIEPSSEERRRIESLQQTRALLREVIGALCISCGWKHDRIHLFGFSQGGAVALDFVLNCGSYSLGSVVAIAASLLREIFLQGICTNLTHAAYMCCFRIAQPSKIPRCEKSPPVLITHGNQDDVVLQADVERSVALLRANHPHMQVTVVTIDKGHAMISSAEEMKHVMAFWAGTLHRRLVGMERNATLYEVTRT